MGTNPGRDFASVLDELIASSESGGVEAARPSIPFDYLAVADELHSGRIKVSSETVAAEYRDMAEDPDIEALFPVAEESSENLPVEPDAISRELKLDEMRVASDFTRLRRTFAFKNHPDRVAPHMREHAIKRMQVANMLIDEAKRRAVKGMR